MKLNVREKVMLIVLGVLGVVALSFFFLIKPQMDRIESLKIEKEALESQILAMENEVLLGSGIRGNIEELTLVVEEMTRVFYPGILPEKIIVLLDELITKTEVSNKTMGIGKPIIERVRLASTVATDMTYELQMLAERYRALLPREETDDTDEDEAPAVSSVPDQLRRLEAITFTLSLTGTYDQVMGFMKEIEALEKTILVTNLVAISNIVAATDDEEEYEEIIANIQIVFYAIPKIHEQDEEYNEWPYGDDYGKENPFIQSVPEEI